MCERVLDKAPDETRGKQYLHVPIPLDTICWDLLYAHIRYMSISVLLGPSSYMIYHCECARGFCSRWTDFSMLWRMSGYLGTESCNDGLAVAPTA